MGQAASFGLTQFEVDELVAYTNGNCACALLLPPSY